jgi:hypothetical protein
MKLKKGPGPVRRDPQKTRVKRPAHVTPEVGRKENLKKYALPGRMSVSYLPLTEGQD